jgi:TPR repeat protein
MRTFLYALLMVIATQAVAEPDFEDGGQAYLIGDLDKAFAIWSELAERNHAESQYNLGAMYLTYDLPATELENLMGNQISPIDKGIQLIERSAAANFPDGLAMIASFYSRGFEQYPQDANKALEYRIKAADTGDALAEYNLGLIYLQDYKTSKEQEGLRLLNSAAKKGFINAEFLMGMFLFTNEKAQDLIISYAYLTRVTNWSPDEHTQAISQEIRELIEKAKETKAIIEQTLSPSDLMIAQKMSEN